MQVRAVAVCRPPSDHDRLRLGGGASLAELDIAPPSDGVPADSPDADLLRDISLGREVLRLPLYGYHGADLALLCQREVAPLIQRLLVGESAAVIAYGQTGAALAAASMAPVCRSGHPAPRYAPLCIQLQQCSSHSCHA